MARPLLAGYLLLALLLVSAIAVFGGLDLLIRQSTQVAETAEVACGVTLLLTYVALWVWMLIDHISGDDSHPVLISIFLVLGGGIAALAYFFLVFRPRYTQAQRGAVRQS